MHMIRDGIKDSATNENTPFNHLILLNELCTFDTATTVRLSSDYKQIYYILGMSSSFLLYSTQAHFTHGSFGITRLQWVSLCTFQCSLPIAFEKAAAEL